MYDLDESYMSEQPSATKTISIAGNAASDQLITETTSPDKPVKETELSGVDEKQTGTDSGNGILLMIALIAIPVILIIVIAVILAKKKKTAPPKHSGGGEPGDHAHGASDMHAGAEAVNRAIDVQDGYGDGGDPYYDHRQILPHRRTLTYVTRKRPAKSAISGNASERSEMNTVKTESAHQRRPKSGQSGKDTMTTTFKRL